MISDCAFCMYGLCMILSVNGYYFFEQSKQMYVYNGEVWCSLWGTAEFLNII
jgi:hypothetical protein